MSNIITRIGGKLKEFRKLINTVFLVPFFVLCVSISFFVGRSVKFLENRPAFYFESVQQEGVYRGKILESEKEKLFRNFETERPSSNLVRAKMIVASSGGTKYYFVWCKASENIKEKNKIYFADEAAAQKAGYQKAASCK